MLSLYDNIILMDSRDPGLDVLLDLDGEVFAGDAEGKYVVRFVVKRVPPSPERPQGLSYSLTLHDETGARLVGFDNAHPPPPGRKDDADEQRMIIGTGRGLSGVMSTAMLPYCWRIFG